MKKKIIVISFILVIIAIIGVIVFNVLKDDNRDEVLGTERFITGNDILYENAVNYLRENDNFSDKYKDKYHLFICYQCFGTTEDDKYKYAYMAIVKDSYYVSNEKLYNGSGNSLIYKFSFDKNNKVLKYEIPEDGENYASSIRRLFPDEIEDMAINYQFDYDKITKEVKDYYSDLKDKNIYHYEKD